MRLLRKDIGTRHAVHSHVCNGVAAERKAQGPDIHTGPDMHRVQTCTGSRHAQGPAPIADAGEPGSLQ